MPWSNVPKEKWPAMEKCVEGLKEKGKDEKRANAICYSSVMGSASLRLQAATAEDVQELQAKLDVPTNTILKFEGACLARAEVNANSDAITDEGIQQIADTIRLMPLTEEHDLENPRGVFVKGYTNEDSTACLVDGFIWAGHFPEFAEEVESGDRKLSMDVQAALAVCNVCGSTFTSTGEYCSHIRNRTPGAVRWLYELTAIAGGAVRYPAGTGTVFPGKEGFTVVSHNRAVAEWWKKHWDKESEIPESSFADKKNRKYPFKGPDGKPDPEGWMAAWRYAHKYNESGVIAVLKKSLPKGYKLEGDSVVKSTGGKDMKLVCESCGHENEITTDAEAQAQKLQSELEAKLTELQAAQERATAAESEAEELRGKLETEQRVVERFSKMASAAGIEVAQDALPSLRTADDGVFETLLAMASKLGADDGDKPDDDEPDDEPKPKPQPVGASGSEPSGDTADTWEIVP